MANQAFKVVGRKLRKLLVLWRNNSKYIYFPCTPLSCVVFPRNTRDWHLMFFFYCGKLDLEHFEWRSIQLVFEQSINKKTTAVENEQEFWLVCRIRSWTHLLLSHHEHKQLDSFNNSITRYMPLRTLVFGSQHTPGTMVVFQSYKPSSAPRLNQAKFSVCRGNSLSISTMQLLCSSTAISSACNPHVFHCSILSSLKVGRWMRHPVTLTLSLFCLISVWTKNCSQE